MLNQYTDYGAASTPTRGLFRALGHVAWRSKFDVVCVTYMSRLGRGESFTIAKHDLNRLGVRVQLVEENFGDGVEGYLSQQMTVMMDGMYPKMVSKWTKTKLTQMATDGFFTGGVAPLGFRPEFIEGASAASSDKKPPQRLVADARDAVIVRDAFDLFLVTRSIARVRDYLKAVTDRKWDTTKTKYLLTNEAYIGTRTIGGKRYEGNCPMLISREAWDQAQTFLEKPGGGVRGPRPDNDYLYYLRGKVFCPHCTCAYTNYYAVNGKKEKIRYYSCLSDMKHHTICPIKRVNADSLHQTILYLVRDAAQDAAMMERLIGNSGGWPSADETRLHLRKQLIEKRQKVAKEIENITRAVAQGGSFKSLMGMLERLEQEQDDLTMRLSQVEQDIAAKSVQRPTVEMVQESWSQLLEDWECGTEDERETILSGLVEKVVVEEKDRVSLKLTSVTEAHGLCSTSKSKHPQEDRFEIKSDLGADTGRIANHAGAQIDFADSSPPPPETDSPSPALSLAFALASREPVNPPTLRIPLEVPSHGKKTVRRASKKEVVNVG